MDERWRADLALWGIPDEIAARARTNPWGHSPARFAERTDRALAEPEGPTRARIAEALPEGGSVLDVGAGTGAASLPLAASLGELIAVDTSAGMLAELESRAADLGVPLRTLVGRWPDVAARTPVADVAVAAHVVYNVPDLAAFLAELSGHARARVVLELTERHPMSWLNPLWAHFHGIVRPERPTVHDVIAVAEALGHRVRHEERLAPLSRFATLEELAESACRRLCLDAERADEVVAAVVRLDMWPVPRDRWFTLWWESK
ncbi:class I SAM-dependent methyltransferase [Streptosporangium sp. NPDC051023]|uniref:class I SAM-dependent methyltransferase n=1 Tax=Streptosporangium sp. NPDC051023 TaxID=3155410 RepID=UPI00344E9D36